MLPRQYESQEYQNTTIANKINTTDEDEEQSNEENYEKDE